MGEAEGSEVLKLAEEKARSHLIAIGAILVTLLLYTSKKATITSKSKGNSCWKIFTMRMAKFRNRLSGEVVLS